MPFGGNQPVYKTTTTRSDDLGVTRPNEGGYLANTVAPGCCSGNSKRRMQLLLLTGAVGSMVGAILLLCLGASAGNGAASLILAVVLGICLATLGAFLFTCYLRTRGRCNLSWWPNRAARLSGTLVESGGPNRSCTQTTLAEEEAFWGDKNVAQASGDERIKLMESDNAEAEKIVSSQPKVVLMDAQRAA